MRSDHSTAKEYLEQLAQRALDIKDNAANLFGGLNGTQLNWKPEPGSWSVGQCLEHIITTDEIYFTRFDRILNFADRDEAYGKRSFKSGNIGRRFINLMKPGGRAFPTLKMFNPAANQVSSSILNDFISHIDSLHKKILDAAEVDISRNKVASPGSSLIRFRLGDALCILVTHAERHMLQAKKVTETKGFPAR